MPAVLNRSTVVTDAEVDRIVEHSNAWMVGDLAPAFGREPWTVTNGGNAYINSVLVDEDKDVPGALAWHDLTSTGHPVMVTMCKTILDAGYSMFCDGGVLSATLHELAETFYDPYVNAIAQGPDGRYWWREICDAVQGMDYNIAVGGGVYAPNFCLPHWFNPDSPDSNVDFQGGLDAPFTIAKDGYQVTSSCDAGTMIHGADGEQRGGGVNAWRTLKLVGA